MDFCDFTGKVGFFPGDFVALFLQFYGGFQIFSARSHQFCANDNDQ
jgi:hypothetical protein